MRKKLIGIILAIPFVLSLMMVNVAKSAPPNTMYFNPPVIWDPNMAVGTEFSVDICVDYVRGLIFYQFALTFDPLVIQGVSVENGPFLGSRGGRVTVYPGLGFNNEIGVLYLFLAACWVGPWARGGGVLATLTFVKVGHGSSPITFEVNSAVLTGDGFFTGPHEDGWFSNEPGPELYVLKRGAHGTSGSWPEWTVGSAGDTQTLYCKIMNHGEMGADVYVEFAVIGAGGIDVYTSNMDSIAAKIKEDDYSLPGEVTVSASFVAGPPGKYRVCVILYFKAGGMTNYVAYSLVEATFGGEGISRDIPVSFKVV